MALLVLHVVYTWLRVAQLMMIQTAIRPIIAYRIVRVILDLSLSEPPTGLTLTQHSAVLFIH